MSIFHNYPYTDMHELNLDWIIEKIKSLDGTVKNFINLNKIKYANPIAWNITSQYEANTVTVDSQHGIAYLSVKAVPSGVDIHNTEYWTSIFSFSDSLDSLTVDNLEVNNIIKYHTPEALNQYFDYIQMQDHLGNPFKVLVDNGSSFSTGQYYNVKNYGAVGDGIEDDTEAINNLIELVSTDGGTVFFPTGTYRITNSIIGKSNVNLLGDVNAVIDAGLLEGTSDKKAIALIGSTENITEIVGVIAEGSYEITVTNVSNLKVGDYIEVYSDTVRFGYKTATDGCLKGEIYNILGINGSTLTLDHGSWTSFDTADNARVKKINFVENVVVDNLIVNGADIAATNEHGIYLAYTNNCTVRNCKINGFDWYSIGVVSSLNTIITNNRIVGTWYNGVTGTTFYAIAVMNNSQWISVYNNYATKVRHLFVCSGYTVAYYGQPHQVNVIGNIAYNMMASGGGRSYAYEHHGSGQDINIIGNIADSCYSGVNIEGAYVNVSNNVIRNAYKEGIGIGDAFRIYQVSVHDNIIHSIINADQTPNASIYVYGSSGELRNNIDIYDNKIIYDASITRGVWVNCVGSDKSVTVRNNNIEYLGIGTLPAIMFSTSGVAINNTIKSNRGIVSHGNSIINNNIIRCTSGESGFGIDLYDGAPISIDNYVDGMIYGQYIRNSCNDAKVIKCVGVNNQISALTDNGISTNKMYNYPV